MSENTLIPLGTDMRKISNSEVATWLRCQRKYYYEFDLNLQPNVQGQALSRGVLLHEILATYYQALKDGGNHSTAMNIGRGVLMQFMGQADQFAIETVMEVDRLLAGYWAFYNGNPDWEIIEVEKQYDVPITDDYEFSMRLDLLVKDRKTGDLAIVDHKTTYDFWQPEDVELNGQFPKYIAALRANGIMVNKVIINQIRTRKIKSTSPDDLYRHAICKPSQAKLTNAMKEQILASEEISKHRTLSIEVKQNISKRVLSKDICKNCDVRPLCISEFDGGDISLMASTEFKQRDYGYNSDNKDKELL